MSQGRGRSGFGKPLAAAIKVYQHSAAAELSYGDRDAFLRGWQTRKEQIMAYIEMHDPEVICLQEIADFEELLMHLDDFGYAGMYTCTSERMQAGIACFWKTAALKRVDKQAVLYGGTDAIKVPIALVAKFEDAVSGGHVVVASVQCRQQAVTKAHAIRPQCELVTSCVQAMSSKGASVCPSILCGDFNFCADFDHPCSRQFRRHPLGFCSAYAAVLGSDLEWTAWTPDPSLLLLLIYSLCRAARTLAVVRAVTECAAQVPLLAALLQWLWRLAEFACAGRPEPRVCDFIWFSRAHTSCTTLKPLTVLKPPKVEELPLDFQRTRLPCPLHPTSHIPLCASFELKRAAKKFV
jgi:endonuclease/exonuclease/phosphatase family metal-dependent hydrolase